MPLKIIKNQMSGVLRMTRRVCNNDAGIAWAWISQFDSAQNMESVHSFVYRKVVVMMDDTPAREAASAMRDNGIGCVLVTDGRQLLGIATDRDFASRVVAEYENTSVPLSDVMTPEVVSAEIDSTMADIVNLMEKHGVRRIPLVETAQSGAEKCVGIVTLDDLVASRSIEPNQLARIVQRQIGRRVLEPSRKMGRTAHAEQRSETRMQQSLQHFYDRIAQETGLVRDKVPQVTTYLLTSLAMRLSVVGAAHMAAQLPKLLQDQVLHLPPGPDRQITPEKMHAGLVERFSFSENYATRLLYLFFGGLNSVLSEGEIEHIVAQLPRDMADLFATPPPLGLVA
jgi:CBS domain-containing protein/uncharacterized protein (DUF2267 family)